MKIQTLINQIFRQDFKNQRVLGRSLFGVAMLFMGLLNLFNVSNYASYAPDYLPLTPILVIGVGILLVLTGFMIFANMNAEKASLSVALLFIAFILIVHLPQSNMLDLAQSLAFMGGALLIAHGAKRERETKKAEKKTT